VAARAEKHRYDPQGPEAVAVQRSGALRQRRLHQFKEGEHDALAGQQFAQLGYELPERPRPLGVARAVGEKDDCSPEDRLFSHGAIMFDATASR